MATRPTWKGFLKIGLVTIPIRVFPATSESTDSLSFNQLHQPCSTRVTQRRWCVACAREVPSAEIVKGFEFEKGRYVILSDADFDKVRPDSTRVIDLVEFADVETLDPVYLNRAYYLAPDGAAAGEAYAVMRDGMAGKVGIGKLALYGREYLVAVRPQRSTLMLYTLHHAGDIRPLEEIDTLSVVPTTAKRREVQLAKQLIAGFSAAAGDPLALAEYRDEYRAQLQRLIDAKVAGEEIVGPVIEQTKAIANLREALTQSLLAVSVAKKTPAKVRPTAKRKRA